MALTLGTLAVVAAVAALLTTRLEHMAAAVGVVGVAFAADVRLDAAASPVSWLLLMCTALVVIIVLGAIAVVEVDARPKRRLQWWKLTLILPLLALAWMGASTQGHPEAAFFRGIWPTSTVTPAAVAVAAMSAGVSALAASLLLRRRQGGEPSPVDLRGKP